MSPAGTRWPWQHTHKLGTAPWAPRYIKIRCNVSVQKTNSTMYWRPNYQHPTQLLVHRVTTYLMTISTTVNHWPEQHKPGRKCFTDTFCFLPMTCFTIPNWKWDKKDVVRHYQCLTYSYLLVVQCLFPCNISEAFSCDKIVEQFRISEAAMQTSASSNVPWSTFQTLSIDQKKIALQCRVCPTPYSPWQSLPWRKKSFPIFPNSKM